VTIYRSGQLAHRSAIFPRYFRFPFMQRSDLQIGDTWTHEEDRGRGLAGCAIRALLESDVNRDRVYWYICDIANRPSRRVVEKLGFIEAGECRRTSRFGLRLFGAFVFTARPALL
jgi:RimJ/RimL family protein N-acetyltransferase